MAPTPPTDLPRGFAIRDVRVEPAVVLAPMEGVTDLPFRRLVRGIGGVGLTCTEFIASEALKRGVGKMVQMARFDPDERPVSVQIYGRRPEVMAEAARIVEDLGATICDINMGCPSRKVVAHSGGAALMREPELAVAIVRAVRAAIRIPLTVKMRAGFDHDHRNAPELAWRCQEEGAEAVTIHWRTRTDMYGGTRRVDVIAEAAARLRVPVIGNGDVVDGPSAERMVRETGCAGVMIGRGAIKDPWAPLQVARHFAGLPPLEVRPLDRLAALLGYIDGLAAEVSRERYVLGRAKQVARTLTRGFPHGATARVRLLHAPSRAAFEAVARDYFERLERHVSGDPDAFAGWEAAG